jgi:hypothetical protein
VKIDQPQVERVTKQERVLTLLSQPNGASIAEMMQAGRASRRRQNTGEN